MPTIITHAVVPLLLGSAAGKRRISRRLLGSGTIAAMLPDTDVLGFRFHIAYADAFGHRGAMHSVAFALFCAIAAMLLHRPMHTRKIYAFAFVGLAVLSHPMLDMLTNGGLGVALAWPVSQQRYFFPWHPIRVSSIGVRFFSASSWSVIESELLWVWLPTSILALTLWQWRRKRDELRNGEGFASVVP